MSDENGNRVRQDPDQSLHYSGVQLRREHVIWNTIAMGGKPVVTVSGGTTSIGTTGADFGYDTMQGNSTPGNTGTPHSNTCGINEALAYAAANGLPTVLLIPGTFTITASISISYNGADLEGYGGCAIEGLNSSPSLTPVQSVISASGVSSGPAINIAQGVYNVT
jgi:hypothetical protein